MEIDKKALGQRIKTIRQSKGLTLEEFGKFFDNASKGVVSNWEKGTNIPNNARLKMIAQFGEKSVNELLYGSASEYEKRLIYEILTEIKNLAADNETVDLVYNRLPSRKYQSADIYNLDAGALYKRYKDFFDRLLDDTIIFDNEGLIDYSIDYIKKMKNNLEVNFKSSYESNFESSKNTFNNIQNILDTTIENISELKETPNSEFIDFDDKYPN